MKQYIKVVLANLLLGTILITAGTDAMAFSVYQSYHGQWLWTPLIAVGGILNLVGIALLSGGRARDVLGAFIK